MDAVKHYFVTKFICINSVYADNFFIRSVCSMHILTNKMLVFSFFTLCFFFLYTLYFSF